jgi:hypothetical protein
MQKQQHTQCNHDHNNRIAYFCEFCKCFGVVYTEHWAQAGLGPFQIDIQIHADNGLEPFESLMINKVPKGEQVVLNYCSDCHGLLGAPIDLEYIEMVSNYNPEKKND